MADIKHYQATPLGEEKYLLGESPFYVPETDTLSWVDILGHKFYRRQGDTTRVCDFGEEIGAAVPTSTPGTYLVCGTHAIYTLDEQDNKAVYMDLTTVLDERHRCNDAKLDPQGRLYFGSSALAGEPSGNLYMTDGQQLHILQPNTLISNGMAWSKDRKHFFFSDSLCRQVYRYDYDEQTGMISGRTALCDMENGVSDGLTIDKDDNLWIALWGGRRVEHRSGQTGELLGIIDVAAEHVSSCYFWGENQERLVITTSGDGCNGVLDGCLFECVVK